MSLAQSGIKQESDVDFRKVQMLLNDGSSPNEKDAFGRPILCYTYVVWRGVAWRVRGTHTPPFFLPTHSVR